MNSQYKYLKPFTQHDIAGKIKYLGINTYYYSKMINLISECCDKFFP